MGWSSRMFLLTACCVNWICNPRTTALLLFLLGVCVKSVRPTCGVRSIYFQNCCFLCLGVSLPLLLVFKASTVPLFSIISSFVDHLLHLNSLCLFLSVVSLSCTSFLLHLFYFYLSLFLSTPLLSFSFPSPLSHAICLA